MTTATFDIQPLARPAANGPAPGRERPALARALHGLLARHDDRLLRDIGLSREEVLGPEGQFWADWNRTRQPWSL